MLVIFGVLHWLVSQSVFVTDEIWTDPSSSEGLIRNTNLGYSPLAILIGLGVLTTILVLIIVQGLWTTRLDMPLLRGCSATIAATCHPKGDDFPRGAQLGAVQWRVLGEPTYSVTGEIGHCGFSAGYIGLPVEGRMYAG